jgi:7,8-dihydropterin-6-yl-methyl-4-(beta-D-ribofuranosyl)aminobenzene 5'-phosphate synthase
MKTKLFLLLILVAFASCTTKTSNSLTNQEELALRQAIENDTLFASWVEDTSNAIKLYKQYKVNVMQSDSTWESDQKRLKKIEDFGYTNKFELVPLVENLYGNAEFKKGLGVSYLIRTDNSTILFDTGVDDDSTMCVLRYNLDILGIDISEIDAIVISHNHGDHQNNWKWINDKTFVNLENENILPNMKIYVPSDKLNLKIATVFSYNPLKISEGVYTTGIIKAPMFFTSTQEQSLIFNVKDKGVVIVTGCGHQTIEKILKRCERITDSPIYGILGGLHFPIDGDSEKYMGYYITGKLPWVPFTLNDVNKRIELIKKRKLKLVGLSTHDSSGKTIEAFKTAFSKEYKDLRTGDWIVVE